MAYAGNFYEKKRQLNMFYINSYGGFWIELLPLLIRSDNIVKIYDKDKIFRVGHIMTIHLIVLYLVPVI